MSLTTCFVLAGYAGFYGLSLIVGSYALLFVSMAAHAAQFAFLALFENPRTSTSSFHPPCSPFPLLVVLLSPRADIERLYGERKLLAERKPIPLSAAQCHQRAAAIQRAAATQRIRSFSAASVSSAAVSEETAIDLDGPVFDPTHNLTGGFDNGIAGSDTPTRMAKVTKHDLLNQYFRKDVVVWSNLDWFRCVCPARLPKRDIYIYVGQDVRLPTYSVNYIHHRMRAPNTYRYSSNALGNGPPPHARAPLAALPHVRARPIAPGTIPEQVCRSPFCEELLLPTRGGSEGRHSRSI